MTEKLPAAASGGLIYALGAYAIWGLLPLYLLLIHQVPPFAFVGWRIVFTVPVCLVIIILLRQWGELRTVIAQPRLIGLLMLSALLIGANSLVYIAAVQAGHVFATSLGYYINPLLNILTGTLFLGEKLNRRQWWAVAIAATGVAPLAFEARETLAISLMLAFTFSGYGLVRKYAPVAPLPGLTIETALLLLPALAILVWQARVHGSAGVGSEPGITALLALSGILTATPMLLFAAAARRLSFSALGFVQFVTPTIAFLLAMFVFHEPLGQAQLLCFFAIWGAIGLFSWDLWRRRGLIPAG